MISSILSGVQSAKIDKFLFLIPRVYPVKSLKNIPRVYPVKSLKNIPRVYPVKSLKNIPRVYPVKIVKIVKDYHGYIIPKSKRKLQRS